MSPADIDALTSSFQVRLAFPFPLIALVNILNAVLNKSDRIGPPGPWVYILKNNLKIIQHKFQNIQQDALGKTMTTYSSLPLEEPYRISKPIAVGSAGCIENLSGIMSEEQRLLYSFAK